MTLSFNCPACASASIEQMMHGGLFVDRCLDCGWERAGTYNLASLGTPRASLERMRVQWQRGAVTASAVKALRAVSDSARRMGVAELSEMMKARQSFELGEVGQSQCAALSQALEQAGFMVTTEAVL